MTTTPTPSAADAPTPTPAAVDALRILRAVVEHDGGLSYLHEDDEVGTRACCGVVEYEPHAPGCHVRLAAEYLATFTSKPEAADGGVDAEWPETGSTWLHTNGNRYTVTGRANDDSNRADYPPVVLYRGEDGRHWAKPLSEWHRNRTLLAPRPEAADAVTDARGLALAVIKLAHDRWGDDTPPGVLKIGRAHV